MPQSQMLHIYETATHRPTGVSVQCGHALTQLTTEIHNGYQYRQTSQSMHATLLKNIP